MLWCSVHPFRILGLLFPGGTQASQYAVHPVPVNESWASLRNHPVMLCLVRPTLCPDFLLIPARDGRLTIRPVGPVGDFQPQVDAPCRAHINKRGRLAVPLLESTNSHPNWALSQSVAVFAALQGTPRLAVGKATILAGL